MKRKIVELTVLSVMLITTLTACANVTINTGNAPASQSGAADTGSNETTGSAATDAGDGGQSADSGQAEQTTSEKAAALDFFAGLKYSADFKQAFYVEYGSEDTAKDHEGELIYIKGEAGEYDAGKHALQFKADDGDWIVTFDKATTKEAEETLAGLAGTKMRVFGTFTGYEKDWNLPGITITKNSIEHACRLEDLDGNTRITYPDTVWADKDADYDYYMGNLIWSGVEEWEDVNLVTKDEGIKVGTVSYYPVAGQSTNIYVYYEKLPKDKANWKDSDAEKMLDKVANSYLGSEEISEKEYVKVAGLNAMRVRATIVPENSDISIDDIQYVILDKDCFYGILFAQTFFIGEKMAAYEKTFMDTVRYNESGYKPKKIGASDIVAKEKIGDGPDDKDEPRGEIAKRSDIEGKLFTQSMETTRIIDEEEVLMGSEDYDDFEFTKDELDQYDEETGKLVFTEDGVKYELEFWIDKDGKVQYSGVVTIEGDKDGYLTASGHETEKKPDKETGKSQ